MDRTAGRVPDGGGLDGGLLGGGLLGGGLVAVDDGGDFAYYASAGALEADYESPGDLVCVLDRQGAAFRLAPAGSSRVHLIPATAAVDYSWLREAWLEAQRRNPHRYPLRRYYPGSRETLLAAVFECLYLRWRAEPWPPPSAVAAGRILADPFGHRYRAAKLPSLIQLSIRNSIKNAIFVEIPAASDT
jgi:hypothetical protein